MNELKGTYFDVVALMVMTTFSEKAMVDDVVYIKLIEQRVTIL